MQAIRLLILIVACFLFTSCFTIDVTKVEIVADKACLPNAVAFQDAIKVKKGLAKYHWTRIFAFKSHAYCAFSIGQDIWVYDVLEGSRYTDIPYEKRNNIEEYTKLLKGNENNKAEWLED